MGAARPTARDALARLAGSRARIASRSGQDGRHDDLATLKIRNPKFESRNPEQIANSKRQRPNFLIGWFWISCFEFVSNCVLRISGFVYLSSFERSAHGHDFAAHACRVSGFSSAPI